MRYAADVIIIILAFAAFGYSHSLLASKRLKRLFIENFKELSAFYRLLYNFVSVLSFYILYILLPRPDLLIYDLPNPWDLIILIPQFLSLGGIIWSFAYIDLWEFAGIRQIKRWSEGNYKSYTPDQGIEFIEKGPYRFSRHPVYFFFILYLAFQPAMNLFYLTLFICITAYFYIGSIYEENKLVEELGEKYLSYRRRVPRILPIKLRK